MMIGNISGKKSGMLLWHVSTSFEFLNVIFCTFEEHHSKKCEMHLWFVLTSFEFKNVIFWTFKEHYRKHMRDNHQISANNSTPLRYSKKTWYSAIIWVQILSQIEGNNFLKLYSNRNFKIRLLPIRASSNRAGIRASTEHDFGFSILSFDST